MGLMQVRISGRGKDDARLVAPATLLGQNLEMAGDTVPGLLSERLSNPMFLGPAQPLIGLAPGWQPAPNSNLPGIRFELTPGMSLAGGESQLIHNYSGRRGGGMLQTGRWTRAGERLTVKLWARAQHHPVTLRVGIRPLDGRAPDDDATLVRVNATYWKPYEAVLTAQRDDNEAVFFVHLEEEGMVWLDQVHLTPLSTRPADELSAVRQDLIEHIRTLEVPVLRFPGGCISTNYHWRYGTGPAHLRPVLPDPVFKWDTSYAFGTDEYLALCEALGIQPQITVNIGSGTPDEAGAWAAYCAAWYRERGLDLPLIYWQMGNEHYGAWELGNMSGEMYAEALHAFVPAVRANYPRTRIIALGPETGEGLRAGVRVPWRVPVLDGAAELIDLLALQCYAGGWDADPYAQQLKVLAEAARIAELIARAAEEIQQRKLNIRVAVTEWNLWLHAGHYDGKGFLEPYDVQHGLFVAAMLHHFIRLVPWLELANFYHVVNPMGVFISRGPKVEETLLADVFRLYRPALPGEVWPLKVECPVLAEGELAVDAVDAACLHTAMGAWLFLANRSLDKGAAVELVSFPGIADGVLLAGEDPLGAFARATPRWRGAHVELPPLSLARLHLV